MKKKKNFRGHLATQVCSEFSHGACCWFLSTQILYSRYITVHHNWATQWSVNCLPLNACMAITRTKHLFKKKAINEGSEKMKTASVHLESFSRSIDANSNASSPLSAAFCSLAQHLKNGYCKKKKLKKENLPLLYSSCCYRCHLKPYSRPPFFFFFCRE